MGQALRWSAFVISCCCFLVALKTRGCLATVQLRGVGASFPKAVYETWLPAYKAMRQHFVDLNMTYEASGSGKGKNQILNSNDIEYAGSDSLLSASENEKEPDLEMFPSMAGATVMAYNLPKIDDTLKLSREQIVGIYNGTFRFWNDTTFKESNPNVNFPNESIVVVARRDKSGTTSMFTSALSKFSAEWKNKTGVFAKGVNITTDHPFYWDKSVIHYYGKGNTGMSGLISSIRYSIGYLSIAAAHSESLKFAKLKNKAGNYVKAETNTIQKAMESLAKRSESLTGELSDTNEPAAYPMVGYTYLIVYFSKMKSCDSAKELVRYIEWFIDDEKPRTTCKDKGMAPLSRTIGDRVKTMILKKITCNRNNVWDMVQEDKRVEELSKQHWRIPVAVTVPLVSLIVFLLLAYIIYQRLKLTKMINNDEWSIPIEDIIFYFDDKETSCGKSKLVGFKSVKSLKSLDDIPEGAQILSQILQWPGKFKGNQVGVRLLKVNLPDLLDRETKKLMLWMRDCIIHTNILRFYGLTEVENDRYVVSEYCSKGQMTDILQDDKYNLTNDFKLSLSTDIASGMAFMHSHGIVHGGLRSSCCIIDSRWSVKVADWEYCKLYSHVNKNKSPVLCLREDVAEVGKYAAAFRDFWTSPEILISAFKKLPTMSSDVYSFAIILQEIYTRDDPYAEHADTLTPEEVLNAVMYNNLRPEPLDDVPVQIRQIVEIAWSDAASNRPTFEQIIKMLKHCGASKKSVLDSMMETMEEYTFHLEERIEERTSELMVARNNMETLLSGFLPRLIVSKLIDGQAIIPNEYPQLGFIVAEIVDYQTLIASRSSQQVLTLLKELHNCLDTTLSKYEVYKVPSSCRNIVLVNGLADGTPDQGKICLNLAHMSLDVVEMLSRTAFLDGTVHLQLRLGAHTGSAFAGMLGTMSPRFCLYGESVQKTIFLMKNSLPLKIHMSQDLMETLEQEKLFKMESGKNLLTEDVPMNTYFLLGRENVVASDVVSESSGDSGIEHRNIKITGDEQKRSDCGKGVCPSLTSDDNREDPTSQDFGKEKKSHRLHLKKKKERTKREHSSIKSPSCSNKVYPEPPDLAC